MDRVTPKPPPKPQEANGSDPGEAGDEAATATQAGVDPTVDVDSALHRVVGGLAAGGEDRPGQARMARAVAGALAAQRHLVVQAGTGTGKSFAYLVPAILSGHRVVVATATKALQDQLADKDIPQVNDRVGYPFVAAVLKGRSNYFCKAKAREVAGGDGTLELDAGAMTGLGRELALVLAWGKDSQIGDRAELDFEPSPRAWAQLSVTATECPGAKHCPVGEDCFAERARQRASEADLIVVNTALYGMHLASGGYLLPEHDVVVFDEAHELEDVAATALGLELTEGRFVTLASSARPLIGPNNREVADRVADAGQRLADLLTPRLGAKLDTDANGAFLAEELIDWLVTSAEGVKGLQTKLKAVSGDDTKLARAKQACGHLAGDLSFLAPLPRTHVAWVEGKPSNPVLKVALVDVGKLLEARLWGEASAVLTSATLPPGIDQRLGLPAEDTDVIDVGSPFEYRTQGMLYVPRHLPDPRHPKFFEGLVEELKALITAAGGRTLGLFTSYRRMTDAADALRDGLPGQLLVQGDLPKPALVEAFASDEPASLFATMGFWQGIDVPGRSLSLVTIDRLPFPRPDDPLTQARRDRAGDAAFGLVDVPRAATLLAQGAGRLIRRASDRGVVAVLDPRLATKSYRRQLLAPMPPLKRSITRSEVETFLREITGANVASRPETSD